MNDTGDPSETQQKSKSTIHWIAIASLALGILSAIGIVINYPFCCSGAISPILGIVVIINSKPRKKFKNEIIYSSIGITLGLIYIIWLFFFAPPIGDIF